MTREEAIEILKPFMACMYDQHGCPISDAAIALDVAISALEQPEIIHCRECKYGEQDEEGRWFCGDLGCSMGNDDGSGFCSDAERSTDD